MTTLDFPNAPYDGQIFVGPNSVIYRWDAAGGLWLTQGMSSNQAIIGVRPPSNATDGQLWFSTVLGQLFVFFDDGTSTQWVPASPATTPPGTISDYAGVSAPGGWYLCDGAIKGRIDDEPLFLAIGTAFGEGDGETTFQLPDLRGRVIAMVDPSALVLAGADMPGALLGSAMHTLSVSEIPSHGHDIGDPGHAHGVADYHHSHAAPGGRVASISGGGDSVYSYADGGTIQPYTYAGPANVAIYASGTGVWVGGTGGSQPHANVQPTMALNKIIKR